MKFLLIVLVILLIRVRFYCSASYNSEVRTFGEISRRDSSSAKTTITTTTAPSVKISEKKIDEEPKQIPKQDKPQQEKIEKSNDKPKHDEHALVEDRTFGRDGLKNILLGAVVVAMINIAPIFLSGLKTMVNLALPILGLLLFRQHRSFRYFDDFMDIFEEFANNVEEDDGDEIEQGKKVIKNQKKEEYPQPQNYPYPNYEYNYYNTNPYRAYGY